MRVIFVLVALVITVIYAASWDSSEEINQEGLVNTIVNTVNKRESSSNKVFEHFERQLEQIINLLEHLCLISAVLVLTVVSGLIREVVVRAIDAAKSAK